MQKASIAFDVLSKEDLRHIYKKISVRLEFSINSLDIWYTIHPSRIVLNANGCMVYHMSSRSIQSSRRIRILL